MYVLVQCSKEKMTGRDVKRRLYNRMNVYWYK